MTFDMNQTLALLGVSALVCAGPFQSSLHAAPTTGDLDIIYINTPGAPSNVVPGLGLPFNAGTAPFVRPFYSRDGNHWAIEAVVEIATTTDDNIYIVDGSLFLREGDSAPWLPAGEVVGTMDDNIAINNAGEILITNNANGTAPSTADDYVVFFDSMGVGTVLAKEGDLIDPILPALAGSTWDDTLDSAVLTDTGLAGWSADGIDGGSVVAADDDLVLLGNMIVARELQVPMGQLIMPDAAWENFDVDDWFVNTDGSRILIDGDMDGPTASDAIVTLNGTVVLQENAIIPGSGFAEPIDSLGIVQVWMDPAGNWYARGNNDVTEQDWVVRNGVVVATSDALQEIVAGSGEHWDDTSFSDCFFAMDGNASGSYLIAGVTDNANGLINGVIVVYDSMGNGTVVAREGDPVDADENGMFDDDRFLNTFGNDDIRLLPDGTVVFVATVRNGAGTSIEQGLFRISPDGLAEFCNGDGGDQMGCTNCPCGNNAPMGTIGGCLNSVSASARLLVSGVPDVSTPADTLHFDMTGGTFPGSFAVLISGDNRLPNAGACPPGSGIASGTLDGLRCVGGAALRHGSRALNNATGNTGAGWGPPANPVAGIGVSSGFIAGQTRHFQAFYREQATLGCMTGQNTSNAVSVTFQ